MIFIGHEETGGGVGKTSEDWYFKIISSGKNKKALVSIILFAIVSITVAIL